MKGSTHQELKRKIVDVLAVLGGVVSVGVIPGLDQSVAYRVGSGLVCTEVVEVEPGSCKSVLDVVHDGSLNGALVCADVSVHQIPKLVVVLFSSLLL